MDYRIDPQAFAGEAQYCCEVLYVVGGLYGNLFALDAVEELVARENGDTLVVLNGDTHWFDKTARNFQAVEERIQQHVPLVGNVEAELRRQQDVGVGCGCAYPDCTPDDAVSRSNRIHKMLSLAVDRQPDLKRMLGGRPATAVVSVAGRRVGITHGDEKLIGGWDCSRESLQDVLRQDELDMFMERNNLDVFVTTHTCAPVALTMARGAVINNGAAGLPNFAGQQYGLVVRIAKEPHPDALFGTELDGMQVEAVPVRYRHEAYVAWFDALWDEASPAAVSYRDRIVNGPDDKVENALLGGFSLRKTAAQERAVQEQPARKATKREVNLALAKLLYFEDMLDDAAYCVTAEYLDTIQVNITAQCNLSCAHCHVESHPLRTEHMPREVMQAVLDVAESRGIATIDITGGAPEMNPHFAWFVEQAARVAERVMVRSNLVILLDQRYAPLMDLYERCKVEVVASLPNVFAAQADRQRGRRSFDGSLEILRQLNQRGYGVDGVHKLDVVFNPQEPVLPPQQEALEDMYRRRLGELGIVFDQLFAVANNPIGRYGASLIDDGTFEGYLDALIDSFNPATCENMMCRHQMSIGWDGVVYDCDFNQALGMACLLDERGNAVLAEERPGEGEVRPLTIFDYATCPEMPVRRPIAFGNHCYACTAGSGSSCGGTLVQE